MNAFRFLLAIMILWILGITGVVAYNHGLNLVPIFFGDMASLTWPGQFNADFICFLILSGLWVAYTSPQTQDKFLGKLSFCYLLPLTLLLSMVWAAGLHRTDVIQRRPAPKQYGPTASFSWQP